MIKVENVDTWGFEHAIRGMRNPMNSWNVSDSEYGCSYDKCYSCIARGVCPEFNKSYIIGENDLDLMQRLYKAGTEHRKYLRQIFVSMDIVAPLYFYKELDTYKVGTTANSCSTMHKIHAKEFTLDDFSHEHLTDVYVVMLEKIIVQLNGAREEYLKTNDKKYWWALIQLLPSSYNQRRTITMNYENVMNIIHQRENHKLDEWRELVAELRKLPYVMEIRGEKVDVSALE